MRSALRISAAALATTTALALTACGDDSGDGTGTDDPAFTTQESADSSTAATGASAGATSSRSADASDSPTTSGSTAPSGSSSEPSGSGSVEVTVTAPESGWQNIIKTGQTSYEMTSDYTRHENAKALPSVSWKPSTTLRDCSTVVSYLTEDGTEIAQYRTTDCSSTSPEGTSSSDYEWLDRSPLPSQGSEIPLTVRVTVESGDGDVSEGTTGITLRNPNNYRS